MINIQNLQKLRPLGKLEHVSAVRHHLGFFNNVGLSAQYKLSSSSPGVFDLRQLIYAAVGDVIRKNRILAVIPVKEDTPDTYFASLPSVNLNRCITFLKRCHPISEGEDKELDAILEVQHNTTFKADLGALPFWRLVILQGEEKNEFTASFVYHHAIGDGISGLVFHKAFHAALEAFSSPYSAMKSEEIIITDENAPILPPLEELHPLPINPAPPSPVAAGPGEWTGDYIQVPCTSRWTSLCISPSASRAFLRECKAKKVSVVSALPSVIAAALFGALPATEQVLTCIIPVSLRPWLKIDRGVADSAIGTYSDATRVRLARADVQYHDNSTWSGAEKVSRALSSYMANVSPEGEPYASIAIIRKLPDLAPIFNWMIGKRRDATFEVTDVGRFTHLSEFATNWEVTKVMLSRSAIASGAAVAVSVATGGDGSMTVGFSWQHGIVEDGFMGTVIQGVRNYFEKYQ